MRDQVRRPAIILLTALLVAGCTFAVSPHVETTTTGAAPTSTVLAGLPVELTDCADPADGFEILCEAYGLLKAHYVDPLHDARLAEGARRGIEEFDPVATGVAAPAEVACARPSSAFTDVCELYAKRQADDPAAPADLAEAAVRGMIQYGLDDPNTVYLSPAAFEHVSEQQSGEVEGIGALVRPEDRSTEEGATCSIMSDTCVLVIVATLEGSPAAARGIQVGDAIVRVDGFAVTGLTADEVVASVRGPAGTDVKLALLRNGRIIEMTVTRAAVVVPVVRSEMIEPDIGYIAFSSFTVNSADQVRESLGDLLARGADKIIFDLQNNPGGVLTAAVAVASEFLAGGEVLRTEAPDGSTTYDVIEGGVATDPNLEVAVIVNRGSASASEVVAAVLQETGRATIVGEPSYGKNTVQQRFDLDNGGALSLTIARWVTPGGHDFGGTGVVPDIAPEVPEGAAPDFFVRAAIDLLRS